MSNTGACHARICGFVVQVKCLHDVHTENSSRSGMPGKKCDSLLAMKWRLVQGNVASRCQRIAAALWIRCGRRRIPIRPLVR